MILKGKIFSLNFCKKILVAIRLSFQGKAQIFVKNTEK
jgi:hypothetical protein